MVNYVAAHGIRTLPLYIRDIINGEIAIKRIEKIVQYDDKENFLVLPSKPNNEVELKKATLAWTNYTSFHRKNSSITVSHFNKDNSITSCNENITQRSSTINATCLFDINIEIQKNKFIGIVGSIGSGKTAFLRSIMGQIRLIKGKVAVRGLTAYVAQDAWIFNGTVRDNIVFGYEFNSKRFYEAVSCCGLTHDLTLFPNGDLTVIGERGITISGGQKQRISIARAYYADRDIYLFDDPFSSVDVSLAKYIFFHCIQNGLKDKTIFLITHQNEFLQATDQVILMKEGRIIKCDTHKNLLKDNEYKELIDESKGSVDESKGSVNEPKGSVNEPKGSVNEPKGSIDQSKRSIDKKEIELQNNEIELKNDESNLRFSSVDCDDVKPLSSSDKSISSSTSEIIDIECLSDSNLGNKQLSNDLNQVEHIESGNISSETYSSYIKAAGGYKMCSFVLIWLALQAITMSFSNWWLSYWISKGSGNVKIIILLKY